MSPPILIKQTKSKNTHGSHKSEEVHTHVDDLVQAGRRELHSGGRHALHWRRPLDHPNQKRCRLLPTLPNDCKVQLLYV